MRDSDLLDVLRDAAAAVRRTLDDLDDWGLANTRAGQYHSDLTADAACLEVLDDAGLGWLSEESGSGFAERELTVVVDPVDGSTNASRGIPWFATSLCVLDARGPRAALVVNQATGRRYEAIRGQGATVDGRRLHPTGATELGHSLLALSGHPDRHLGWEQYRVLGAAALDLCAVAEGMFDGYVDCSPNAHGAWDYLGGLLVCREAGVPVADAFDRELVVRGHRDRRTPVAGATAVLLDAVVEARRAMRAPGDPEPADHPQGRRVDQGPARDRQ